MSLRHSSNNLDSGCGSASGAQSRAAAELLKNADSQLETAVDCLLAMNPADMRFPASLQLAAELIESIQPRNGAEWAQVEPMLRKVAAKAAAARRLLDSAAVIHFGSARVASSIETGYLPDGKTQSSGGAGSLWVQG